MAGVFGKLLRAVGLQRIPRGVTRQYAAAKQSRLRSGFIGNNSSADFELDSSLRSLRTRSRQLVRDAPYAKRARMLVINNVIGSGIGLQCHVKNSRGQFNRRINSDIEDVFCEWARAEFCHTGGRLSFKQFERVCMGQVFEAGEVFIREHYTSFGGSRVPYALELIEAERVADELSSHTIIADNEVRMGVEMDRFQRPIAYYIRERHPLELRFGTIPQRYERVPADQIIHLAVIDRWPQSRGEPWLHACASRLNDMDGYSEAEIVRARVQAASVGAIETPEDASSFGEPQDDGTVEMEVEPGVFKRLAPGEKLNFGQPSAPNSAMDGFMRYMLREICSGIGVSYASMSNDYSQSNYSSSRLALLDDRDLWKFLQVWFINEFRQRVHRHFLQQAVFSQAIKSISLIQYAADPKSFEAVRFRPRGWSWIDPTKEVDAFKSAIKAGLTTVEKVISSTSDGDDLEDIMTARAAELEFMEDLDLAFDTSPSVYVPAETRGKMVIGPDGGVIPAATQVPPTGAPGQAAAPADEEITEKTKPEPEEPAAAEGEDDEDRSRRVVNLRRRDQ